MLIKFLILALSVQVGCNLILGYMCHKYYTEMKFLDECMHELTVRCVSIMIEHDIDLNELRRGNETSDIEIEQHIKLSEVKL